MESMIDHVAKSLNLEVEDVKRANLYRMGQVDSVLLCMHMTCICIMLCCLS